MGTSTFIKIDGPLMSLEQNKEKNKVAVAGRRAFKIFSIDDGTFVEDLDLRGTDTVNLNYSFTDVTWNLKDEHILATAATNGAIITWNLNKNHHSKQDRVFLDHKRTVNRIGFHIFEPWLISCSQDSTIRCFDYRMKESVRIFKSNTESIRDVKFSPHNMNTFAAVSENGSLQLWDIRRQDKFYMQYAAHAEPIFSCDWHSECQWIATGSRDKSIKVWDVTHSKPVLKYTVNTIASVGRVKWRPMRKYQLASTALVVDWNVNIWDLKRPYIPFACFRGHRDIVTDIVWRSDPKTVLSTGRDSLLYYHVFADAVRPADSANPQAVSLSCHGDIMYSHRININPVTKSSKIQGLLRRSTHLKAEFSQNSSQLNAFAVSKTTAGEDDATGFFVQFATSYILTGRSLTDICEHNSAVAKSFGKFNISFVWDVIKQIFATSFFESEEPLPGEESDISMSVVEREETEDEGEMSTELAIALEVEDELPDLLSYDPKQQMDELITDPCVTVGDFLFGDKEMDPLSFDYDNCENLCLSMNGVFADKFDLDENDWNLPSEAFALRHEIKESSPPPELIPDSIASLSHDDAPLPPVKVVKSEREHLPLHVKWSLKLPRWNSSELILETLQHHANEGDFQTAACVLLVLGERRRYLTKKSILDEVTQEQWLLTYIEMLNRYKLWNISTEVIKLSWICNVNQMNQHSTTMRTSCGGCGRALVRSGWLCDRCHSTSPSVCSICHRIVKGLFIWCQGCTHGGHLTHIRSWLRENKLCPAGCGHACEY